MAPIEAIKAQGRGLVGEHRTRFAGTLVILQVGLSLVLVVFAGLFVSSFVDDENRHPTVSIVCIEVTTGAQGYVVCRAFVRKFFPAGNVLGSTVTLTLGRREEYSMGTKTIVGVVGDTIYSSLREAPQAIMYLPLAQYDLPVPANAFMNITVRAAARLSDGCRCSS